MPLAKRLGLGSVPGYVLAGAVIGPHVLGLVGEHAAGAARAQVIVIAIDNEEKAVGLVETVQQHFPALKIYARAAGRVHAYEFQKRGVMTFYRETLGSSLDLGMSVEQAQRASAIFKRHDEASVRDPAQYWEDNDAYLKNARLNIEAFEQLFASDASGNASSAAPASAGSNSPSRS